jgi:hypothetical protein
MIMVLLNRLKTLPANWYEVMGGSSGVVFTANKNTDLVSLGQ